MSRHVSFAQLGFVPDPGITGFRMAPVADDRRGLLKFWKVPAGWGLGQLGIEANLHFHRRAWEYAAILGGDFPHIEYDKSRDELRRIRFVPGDLMVRAPGSLHGLHRDMVVHDDCVMLYWNTGSGTSLLDRDYADETVDVTGDVSQWSSQLNDDCAITPVAFDERPGATRLSRPADACEVTLLRMQPGDSVDVEDLVGENDFFALLWQGRCTVAGGEAAQWDLLLREPGSGPSKGLAVASTASCWLKVSRRLADHAAP